MPVIAAPQEFNQPLFLRLAISVLAVSLCLIATMSCGSPSGGALGRSESSPAASSRPAANKAQPAAPAVSAVDAEFPAALVGTWSGGGGKRLTFGADGRYQSNSPLGEGQAVVSGDRIMLTPDGQQAIVTTWSVSGGKLYLGTSVYLRDDPGPESLSLAGMWIEANGYAIFRFAADGTYDFSDPARGRRGQGTYAVEGRTLTISPSTTVAVFRCVTALSLSVMRDHPGWGYIALPVSWSVGAYPVSVAAMSRVL